MITEPSPAVSRRARAARRSAPPQALVHVDGLDGLRGLAVAAVVLYHGGIGWATGGFLGVELFFVLSGFLITSLLIREWTSRGRIDLADFWARRARRLLPALMLLVVVIGIRYAITGTYGAVPGLFGDGLAALFYYSNWHQIAAGTGYFAQTGPTSPFQHTWSLAIEEQFYVIWPLLLLGVAALVLRRSRRSGSPAAGPSRVDAARLLDVLLLLALGLLLASAIDMALLFHGGRGLDRVYFGTDTRATGLLAGAALAIFMGRLALAGELAAGSFQVGAEMVAGPRATRRPRLRTPAVSIGSAVALAICVVLMIWADGTGDHWLYPWGFLLVDALSVALIAVILTNPRTIASRIFCLEPLRWLGSISYGLYLWHFPLFLWIDQANTGRSGFSLFALRISVAILISTASYYVLEQPIRQRRWPARVVLPLAPIAAGTGVLSLALATAAAAVPSGSPTPLAVAPQRPSHTAVACRVALANTPTTGEVAPPLAQRSSFQTNALGHGSVQWPTAAVTTTFTSCPPGRALVAGDSIAFTMTEPFLYNEAGYGLALSDAAVLGCGFADQGQLDVNGIWETPTSACTSAFSTWNTEASAFGAKEIIVELGYRDEFDWRWNNQVVHLGEPAFDAYDESRIRDFIDLLSDGGTRKLLFLTVPYVSPPAQADGTPAPQASTARHAEINSLIRQAVAASPRGEARVIDVDRWLSPGGHYSTNLNGQLCRFDGVHLTVYCAEQLEAPVLDAARGVLGSKPVQ